MLIFDEADSLLFDRREAVRSWEVSQVNEMLTWMEQHPLPFCCTTKMMEKFDSASLRR
jgi:transitional endoplasmic reticulum ATPase